MARIIKSLWDIAGEDLYKKIMSKDYTPEETERAYKMFRTDGEELFPLFVDSKSPVPVGEWQRAISGEATDAGKVKSKIGPLAYRPGWHAGDNAAATHIGAKSDSLLKAPDTRRPEHVWAEVDMADDVDWQSYANAQGTQPRTKHVTDTVPYGGQYRYKTNSNMDGDWHIGGDMRVNRVLSDEEVAAINKEHGLLDLPRREPSSELKNILSKYGAVGAASTAGLLAGGQSENADAGGVSSLVKAIRKEFGDDIDGATQELVRVGGYPESVARKIADGTLPMDEASREARADAMGMGPDMYRGHADGNNPRSNQDLWMTDDPDVAQTYAMGGEYYDEALDAYAIKEGHVTPLRHNANNLFEMDAEGQHFEDIYAERSDFPDFTDEQYESALSSGTDGISSSVKDEGTRQGSRFTNIQDDFDADGAFDSSTVENVLGTRPDVKIRSTMAAFDPDYNGPNIMGGLLAGGVGLGALGQSEDADAGRLAAPMIKNSGMISSPRSENLFNLTMGARDVERRLEGSPASLLFPSGVVDYLETVNRRTEDPNAKTRLGALLDFL